MTVILRGLYSHGETVQCFFMADLLISSEDTGSCDPHLPTTETPWKHIAFDSKYWPIGLSQKLVVVSDDIALGFAGSAIMARSIMKSLRADSAFAPACASELAEYLKQAVDNYHQSNHPKDKPASVQIAGFMREGELVAPIQFGCDYAIDLPPFRNLAVLGTGDQGVPEFMSRLQREDNFFCLKNDDKDFAPLLTSLKLAGALLNEEVSTQANFRDLYGAGYEIISLTKEGFKKNSDVLYIFWYAMVADDGSVSIRTPYRACRYEYRGDVLLVHSARFNRERAWTRVFVVEPLDRNLKPEERVVPPASFNSRVQSHSFLVYFKDEQPSCVYQHIVVKSTPEEKAGVLLEPREGGVFLHYDKSFLLEVQAAIHAAWVNRPAEMQ